MASFIYSILSSLPQQPENAMRQFTFSPMEMLHQMSWTGIGVVVVLLIMSIYYFTNRVRVFEIEMSNSGDELIDYFLQQREAP